MVQTSNKLNEAHVQNAYNIQDTKTSELFVKVYIVQPGMNYLPYFVGNGFIIAANWLLWLLYTVIARVT